MRHGLGLYISGIISELGQFGWVWGLDKIWGKRRLEGFLGQRAERKVPPLRRRVRSGFGRDDRVAVGRRRGLRRITDPFTNYPMF